MLSLSPLALGFLGDEAWYSIIYPSDSDDDVGLGDVWFEGNPDPFVSSSVSLKVFFLSPFLDQSTFRWIESSFVGFLDTTSSSDSS